MYKCSRKIVSVKTLKKEQNRKTFVKALIKKSYGDAIRRYVVLFKINIQAKPFVNVCPAGLSNIHLLVFIHILATLTFLKHFYEAGKKSLT